MIEIQVFKVQKWSREPGDNPFRNCPIPLSRYRPTSISAGHETVFIDVGCYMTPCLSQRRDRFRQYCIFIITFSKNFFNTNGYSRVVSYFLSVSFLSFPSTSRLFMLASSSRFSIIRPSLRMYLV